MSMMGIRVLASNISFAIGANTISLTFVIIFCTAL